jgi:tol-pal system protein YbgF
MGTHLVGSWRATLLLAATLAMSGCMLLEPPADDPARLKLDELDRRMDAVERVVRNQSLVNMTQQVAAVERQSDELRGRVETLENDAGLTASRQRQLYADLDSRIQALEEQLRSLSASGSTTIAGDSDGQLPVPGGSDRENYQASFELLKEQRYEAAATAFQQFLLTFPDSELSDNAQYWLVESFYVTQQFAEALAAFEVVINDFPRSRKAPDALLKIGYCHYELKGFDAARQALRQVAGDYPDTTAARLAGQRLQRMDEEGV